MLPICRRPFVPVEEEDRKTLEGSEGKVRVAWAQRKDDYVITRSVLSV